MRSIGAAGRASPHRAWAASFGFVAAGFAVSAYLTARAFATLGPPGTGGRDLCAVLFKAGCDGAVADSRFWLVGIPVAGWGLVYFASLAALLFLARFVRSAFEAEALLAGTLVTLAGLGAGVGLSVAAWLGGTPACPLCLSVHAINLVLVASLMRAGGGSVREQMLRLRDAWGWLRGAESPAPDAARWKLVGFASVALVAAMAYQWVYVESAIRRPAAARAPDRARIIAAYRESPRIALPVGASDPRLGPITAPVQLVVFGSLECPAYRRFAGTLAPLRQRHGDRLQVVFKHYPLSTLCNARLTEDMQPEACALAWAAEAARAQDRFWPFHDALLAAAPTGESVAEAARRAHLDAARFDADRRSEAARLRVAADVALGNRLEIPGTPTIYLDGRAVRTVRSDVLEILIRHELESRSERPLRHGRAHMDPGRLPHEGRPS